MGIPIVSDILKSVSDFTGWFIGVIPKPVAQILFIFMIMFVGSIASSIVGHFTTFRYSCDETCQLVDDSEANKCGLAFMTGYFYKTNLSQSECYTMSQASDSSWNHTVCDELIPKVVDTSLVLWFTEGIKKIQDNILISLFGNGSTDKSDIYGYFTEPYKVMCNDLYDCLSPTSRFILNMTDSCTIERGLENTGDNYPTIDEFLRATRFNKTVESAEMGDSKIFSMSCFEQSEGCEPETTFMGFPFLNWRFWMFIFFFVALIQVLMFIRTHE